jgi:hypothetical protein
MSNVPALRTNYLVVLIIVACVTLIAADRVWSVPLLRSLTAELWTWVMILAACAALLGVVNVLVVHLRQVVVGTRSWANSLILVATALVVFVMGLLGPGGSRGLFAEWVFDSILAPGMATLFAMLAFFTAAAAYRYLRIGGSAPQTDTDDATTDDGTTNVAGADAIRDPESAPPSQAYQGGGWMLAGALLFLLLQMPMLNAVLPPAGVAFAGWVLDVPAMATLRGALVGGSVAIMVLGLRLALVGK